MAVKLPALEKLHGEAIARIQAAKDGYGPKGFGAILDAARYIAIAEVCAAIRKDLSQIPELNKLNKAEPTE